MFVHIVDLKEQFIIDHNVMLNLRKSANVGLRKSGVVSSTNLFCFLVFPPRLLPSVFPTIPSAHLRTATHSYTDAMQCNTEEYNPMQSAHRKDATRWTSVKYLHCIQLQLH